MADGLRFELARLMVRAVENTRLSITTHRVA